MEVSSHFVQVDYDPDTEIESVTTSGTTAIPKGRDVYLDMRYQDQTEAAKPDWFDKKEPVTVKDIPWSQQRCRNCGYMLYIEADPFTGHCFSLCRYNGSDKVRREHPACPAFFLSE